MHIPSSKACSPPQCPADPRQTASPPVLARIHTSRPRRATLEPPGRSTPSQTGSQPFRPDPHAPQADPAAPPRLSRSPSSSARSPPAWRRSLPDLSHPHFPSINPLPPYPWPSPPPSSGRAPSVSPSRSGDYSSRRATRCPARCTPGVVVLATWKTPPSPHSNYNSRNCSRRPAPSLPPLRLPRMRGAGCCCGGAARPAASPGRER